MIFAISSHTSLDLLFHLIKNDTYGSFHIFSFVFVIVFYILWVHSVVRRSGVDML